MTTSVLFPSRSDLLWHSEDFVMVPCPHSRAHYLGSEALVEFFSHQRQLEHVMSTIKIVLSMRLENFCHDVSKETQNKKIPCIYRVSRTSSLQTLQQFYISAGLGGDGAHTFPRLACLWINVLPIFALLYCRLPYCLSSGIACDHGRKLIWGMP